MEPDRFQNSPSGKVIQVWQGNPPYAAFVPNPLPPEIAFETELVRALSEADRALGELAGLGRMMPNPNLLIQPFIRREAVLSSRIEGTQTDIQNLYAYEIQHLALFGEKAEELEADAHEVSNYVRALEYGLKRVKKLPVSLRLIRELHEHLMKGVRGERARPGYFRDSQNWIGAPGCALADATFVPPPPPEMNQALDAFEKYLHADDPVPPLVRLACVHYQFEAIHPFLDGNGRIGRLLISLLLSEWNLLPQPLLYLSAYFERRRDTYYDSLLAVSERGAWREWVLFFLQGASEQARDALIKAKKLQDLQHTWHQRVTQARSSALLPRLIDHLFSSPIVTIPRVEKLLKVTYHSAKLNVDKLVEAKILVPTDARHNKAFIALDILKIIIED